MCRNLRSSRKNWNEVAFFLHNRSRLCSSKLKIRLIQTLEHSHLNPPQESPVALISPLETGDNANSPTNSIPPFNGGLRSQTIAYLPVVGLFLSVFSPPVRDGNLHFICLKCFFPSFVHLKCFIAVMDDIYICQWQLMVLVLSLATVTLWWPQRGQ